MPDEPKDLWWLTLKARDLSGDVVVGFDGFQPDTEMLKMIGELQKRINESLGDPHA